MTITHSRRPSPFVREQKRRLHGFMHEVQSVFNSGAYPPHLLMVHPCTATCKGTSLICWLLLQTALLTTSRRHMVLR